MSRVSLGDEWRITNDESTMKDENLGSTGAYRQSGSDFRRPAEKLPMVSREAPAHGRASCDTAGGGARAPRHSSFGIFWRHSSSLRPAVAGLRRGRRSE